MAVAQQVLRLSDLDVEEKGVVLSLQNGRAVNNRLVSLGFTPGVMVEMIQNYGRGPLMVTVRGTRVALGRGEASKIMVDRLPHE
ncbi:MAG: FeoA family protein [Anaerolineaceae bacterium]|nr:ferrous iron transport protein A [Anaerolineaceae bacterium]